MLPALATAILPKTDRTEPALQFTGDPFATKASLRDMAEIPRPAFAQGYCGQAKLGMTRGQGGDSRAKVGG